MDSSKKIACVTGASGMVGSKIVQLLILQGYRVRVLSRKKNYHDKRVELFNGGLEDESTLRLFIRGAHLLFHCAAEIYYESKMWDVNVLGTERLLGLVKKSSIKYLCYLSSAGVVGKTNLVWVNEESPCNPQNSYERSKWAAEQLVARGIDGCRIVILRPTNVIDESRPGALILPMRGSWIDCLKVYLKGGECARIVHAEDVAAAALYFLSYPPVSPECFIVSYDHEPLNTYAWLWALYRACQERRPVENIRPALHLPIIVPHLMRWLLRRRGNRGNVRYSSAKLISRGFTFPLGLKGAMNQIISAQGAS